MIVVDRESSVPLYEQIYGSVRDSIVSGAYKPGERLPSIRFLMSDLGVSRNTAANAYRQLVAEGYARSEPGSGFRVADVSIDMLATPNLPGQEDFHRTEIAPEPEDKACRYDFYYGNLVAGSFPAEAWRRLVSDVLYPVNDVPLSSYNRKRGEIGLRTEIARYLKRSRGVKCVPEQIVLTSGTQQSLMQLLALFDCEKHAFAMENPGYDGSRVVAADSGFPVVPVRSDAGPGAFLADVEASGAKLVYTTPSHQMPMGGLMDVRTRAELLRCAVQTKAYVIEDDYDSEFRFDVRPVPSLQSLDLWDRVVYLGTFSKVLSPALRLSYMVLPPKLLNAYNRRFGEYYSTVPWLEQEVLRRFMANGMWERHISRTIRDVRARHDALMSRLAECFGQRVEVIGGSAGLHLLLRVKNGMVQEELVSSAAERDVKICLTRHYWMNPSESPDDLVLLGYSSATIPDIDAGLAELARAWFPTKGD